MNDRESQTAPPSLDEDAREEKEFAAKVNELDTRCRLLERVAVAEARALEAERRAARFAEKADKAADHARENLDRAESAERRLGEQEGRTRAAIIWAEQAEVELREARERWENEEKNHTATLKWARSVIARAEKAEAELRTAQADLEATRAEADTHYGVMVDAKAELRNLRDQFNTYAKQVDEWIKEAEADRDRLLEAVREARAALNFGATKSGHREAWKILDRASDDGGKR
jgi:chromosome segregation ATPase